MLDKALADFENAVLLDPQSYEAAANRRPLRVVAHVRYCARPCPKQTGKACLLYPGISDINLSAIARASSNSMP